MGKKLDRTDRSHGGPGSSHEDATQPQQKAREAKPSPGEPTNRERSRVGSGGGERDIHHSHDPAHKS